MVLGKLFYRHFLDLQRVKTFAKVILGEEGGEGGGVVHNCTIFLLPLDVRNIVQGGDPLYAVFFSTQGSGRYT